jgi:hypothetical protein
MAFEKLRTIVITAILSRDPAKGSARLPKPPQLPENAIFVHSHQDRSDNHEQKSEGTTKEAINAQPLEKVKFGQSSENQQEHFAIRKQLNSRNKPITGRSHDYGNDPCANFVGWPPWIWISSTLRVKECTDR